MKLIFCPECQDVIKLQHEPRLCMCGASGGQYLNDVDATIHGQAIPIGFDNPSMARAMRGEAVDDRNRFTAFVIDMPCVSITRSDRKRIVSTKGRNLLAGSPVTVHLKTNGE